MIKKFEKVLSNLGINGNFLNLIKVVCQKPQNAIVVNIFKNETLSALPSKDQVQSKDTHSHQFCSILNWYSILCNKARKKIKNKKHNGWKGKSKITSIHRWYNYPFSRFEASTEQVWEQSAGFVKAAEYKVNTQSTELLHISDKQLENEIKEMIPYTTALKNTEILRDKLNEKSQGL